jgi:hypothetical protein
VPDWPDFDGDHALRKSTLRLMTPASGFAGTGFVIDLEGRLLTCHHVAAGHAELAATDANGGSWTATPDGTEDPDLARLDLAVLRLEGDGALPPPVPLSLREPGARFRSRVQQKDMAAFREAAPVSGEASGPMRIAYGQAGPYAVDGLALAGVQVQPGMSGAPMWDPACGAVVGVLAVSANDPNLGGFAIPLERARAITRLQQLIAINERQVPRYGDRPNRLGLEAILSAASEHTVERLKTRGIVGQLAPVHREGFDEKLSAYLASDETALAVVSAAGQGKTNLLIQALAQGADRPAWLVRCADVASDERPAAWLNRLLREQGAPAELAWPGMAGSSESGALLLVDGLNEAPLPAQLICDEWLPDLIDAARASGWRLVYTTRRELFAMLPKAMREEAFALGRYTRVEAQAAAHTYGLVGRAVEREPLLLRIRAEVGGGASRSQVLDQFVQRLLQGPPIEAYAGHPAGLEDELAAVAARGFGQSDGETGLLTRSDPFFADRKLAAALCRTNLLEIVPAGYRFVFDEVADYLRARGVAAHIGSSPDVHEPAWEQVRSLLTRPNALALLLELLAEQGQAEVAAQIAGGLCDMLSGGPEPGSGPEVPDAQHIVGFVVRGSWPLTLFGVIGALPDIPLFGDAKSRAIEWAVSREDALAALTFQIDLLSGFSSADIVKVAKAAAPLDDGYGWREKDVWSEWHRHSTMSIARQAYGVRRVILDLFDDEAADVAGALIDWLSDPTRLSSGGVKFASTEATVGSFALCMLFAYRERIGVPRLLDEVLKPERPGWGALAEGLAAEDTEVFLEWLEGLDPGYAAGRLSWIGALWRTAIGALRAKDRLDELERPTRALSSLIPHLDSEGLGRLVDFLVGYELPAPELKALIRRAASAGALDPIVMASALRQGLVELADALEMAGETGRDRLVWSLVSGWRPETDLPPLAELVPLMRQTSDWQDRLPQRATGFESLLYLPGLEAARSSGLCDAVDELLAGPTKAVRVMAYVAFDVRQPSEQQLAFRIWLADRLLPKLGESEFSTALNDVSQMDGAYYQRYREIARKLAQQADEGQMLGLCGAQNRPRLENLAELLQIWQAAQPRSGPRAEFLAHLLSLITSDDPDERPSPKQIFDITHDYFMQDRP